MGSMSNQIPTDKLQNGDRFGIAGTSWISRQIIAVMKHVAKRKKLTDKIPIPKILGQWIPSHWGTLHFEAGKWRIYESISQGFKPTKFLDAYSMDDNFIILRTPNFTTEQKTQSLDGCLELEWHSVTYGFFTLVMWLIYAYLRINLFPFMGMACENCYETTHQVLKWIFPDKYSNDTKLVPYWYIVRDDDEIVIDKRQ
jgi:hypothetical protein